LTDRLDSWKEIAAHLNRQVRTVQRWEKTEGLPVHRHVHASRGTVFALRNELDDWLRARTAPAAVPAAVPGSGPVDQANEPLRSWRTPGRMLLIGLALALIGLGLASSGIFRSSQPPEKVRVVVLPFRTLGTEPIDAAVSTGFLEEVITHLARIEPERLAVIGRTSAMRFADTRRSPAEIGHELGVSYVLEGSLKRQADRLRVTTRLVSAGGEELIWSETFDLEVTDLFLAEQRVSQTVARSVGRELLGVAAPLTVTSPADPEAHDAWLRGRYLFHKGTRAGFLDSREHFEAALERSPNMVEAHVGLAHAHNLLGRFGHLAPADTFPAGKAAALRALEIDPHCAEAHASLALALFYFDWDFPAAAREFQRAIELAPGLALAHHWYAHFLSAMGLPDEAICEVRIAQELEPLWALITSDAAWFYYRARRFDEAIAASRRALDIEPTHGSAATCLAASLVRTGEETLAWSELRAFLESSGTLPHIPNIDEGGPDRSLETYWEWARAGSVAAAKQRYIAPVIHAFNASAAGNIEQALHWLEVGLESRDRGPLLTLIHPHFDPLRDDGRFQRIIEAVGFPADPAVLLPSR
jgi:TolB-like protein/tetratricopeptide (TPR) repeat protein